MQWSQILNFTKDRVFLFAGGGVLFLISYTNFWESGKGDYTFLFQTDWNDQGEMKNVAATSLVSKLGNSAKYIHKGISARYSGICMKGDYIFNV